MMLQQAPARRSRLFPEELPAQGQAARPAAPPPRETGFGENFGAGFREMLIAGNIDPGGEYGLRGEYDRILQQLALRGELARVDTGGSFGTLPAPFENPFSAPFTATPGHLSREESFTRIWEAIARQRRRDPNFLREFGADRHDLERIVHQRNQAELRQIREVQAGATGWGGVGGFLGGATGNLLDIGNLAALPTGGAARTIWGGMARAALNNVLVEAVEQPYVVGRYRQLGEAHDSPGELLTSLGGAAVFGAGLHAAGRGTGALYDRVLPHIFESLPEPLQRRWADSMRLGDGPDAPLLIDTLPHVLPPEAWTPDTRAAVHVLEREEEVRGASPFEATPAGDEAHGQRMTAALRALESGEPYVPDPGPFGGAVTRGTVAGQRFGSRREAIVALGQELVDRGLIVGENRHVGNRRFTPGAHQTGEAHGDHMIDVNDSHMPPGSARIEARNPEVRARFDAMARDAQARGYRVLWNEHIYEPYGDGPGRRIPGADTDSRQHRNHIHFEAPQALVDGSGDPRGRTPGAHFGDPHLPAGIRNNNPGNLGDGELARSIPGYAGSDGRFARFETMEAGIAAQEELLRRRIGQGRSIETLIRGTGHNDGYAPSERTGGDNPEAAVQSYVAELARRLGKEPGARLTEADIPRLAEAMRDREAPHWRDYLGAGAAPERRAAAAGDGGEGAAAELDALRAEAELRAAEGGEAAGTSRGVFDAAGEAESAFAQPPVLRRDTFDSAEAWAAAQREIDRGWRIENGLEDGPEISRPEPGNGPPARETGGEVVGRPGGGGVAEALNLAPAERTVSDIPERVKATVAPDAVGEFMLSPAMTRESGPPGLSIERSDDGSEANVVWRDEEGRARGVLFVPMDKESADAFGGVIAYVDPELRRQGIATRLYAHGREAGLPIDQFSGKGDLTPDGAAFVNASRARVGEAVARLGRRARADLNAGAAAGALFDAPALKRFDAPDGEGARAQADSIAHDLRAEIAADPATGARVFVFDGDEARPLAEMLDELDSQVAAAAAIRTCL